MTILEEYKESKFYKKYQDQYFSDSIIRNVFGIKIRAHRFYKYDYDFVYNKIVEVMEDFVDGYIKQTKYADDHVKKLMLYSIYVDPDNLSIVMRDGIKCTADGLLSLRRMYKKYGISSELVSEYRKYRRTPIFHFPQEKNGINMVRKIVFGDRIDHTLYDLKKLCEGEKNCRLQRTYQLPKTSQWLKSFNYDFSEIVKWLGVSGIFVNEKNEIYDLEYDDGSIICEYSENYNWEWSEDYYNHLKQKIEEYESKNSLFY